MRLAGLLLKRRWLARRQHPEPYQSLLEAPLPDGRFRDLELVCLDIETTGLDAATADVLSIGWVLIRGNRVDLSSAKHFIVCPEQDVGDSAAVHGLTDTMVETGHELRSVLDRVIVALTGRALVVHFAGLDKAILDRACQEHYGATLCVPVIDTLAMESRRERRRHHVAGPDSLRLPDLREHYHLPYYAGHDALADAIATAELLLAMVAVHGDPERTRLADLL